MKFGWERDASARGVGTWEGPALSGLMAVTVKWERAQEHTDICQAGWHRIPSTCRFLDLEWMDPGGPGVGV